jgi:hypothetical protein
LLVTVPELHYWFHSIIYSIFRENMEAICSPKHWKPPREKVKQSRYMPWRHLGERM